MRIEAESVDGLEVRFASLEKRLITTGDGEVTYASRERERDEWDYGARRTRLSSDRRGRLNDSGSGRSG